MSFTREDARAEAQEVRRFRHHHTVCVRSIECDCDAVFGVEPVETVDEDEIEDDEPDYCTVCDGTGEGMLDGRSCRWCRGTGVDRRRR